jgi:hypothetical protein
MCRLSLGSQFSKVNLEYFHRFRVSFPVGKLGAKKHEPNATIQNTFRPILERSLP